jgi:hypothetical protein
MAKKRLRRCLLAAAALHLWAVKSLGPTAGELLDPGWHLEVPLRVTARGLARLLPYAYERWGERGVKSLQFIFYQVGVDRAPLLQRFLQIDPDDARSLGRVLDYEDGLVGVRGVWTEECRGRAVKEERYCPIARDLAECPEVCTRLMMALEAGTFSVLNPDLAVPELTKLLSTGDDCCLAVLELPYLKKREARQSSPQATPGEFPPRLRAPGLQWRLMLLAPVSLLKALYRLAVTGPDGLQMHWYEFFRYQPTL